MRIQYWYRLRRASAQWRHNNIHQLHSGRKWGRRQPIWTIRAGLADL